MTELKAIKPNKCHLWTKGSLAVEELRFRIVEAYAESSHFYRRLLACEDCGQRYYHEWYEQIDWNEGNDSQYTTFIPIEPTRTLIDELNKASPFELLQLRPRLQIDSKGELRVKWIR